MTALLVSVTYRLSPRSGSPNYDILSLLFPSMEANNGNRNQKLCVSLGLMKVEASKREDRFVFLRKKESKETSQGIDTWKTDTARVCRHDYNNIHLFSRDWSRENNIKQLSFIQLSLVVKKSNFLINFKKKSFHCSYIFRCIYVGKFTYIKYNWKKLIVWCMLTFHSVINFIN